jgi:DNA-binding transcriptional LysR family regulator
VNISWLDDFLALATTGNFSRAADERHMTQPAFSRRIRALEEWLGVELFDRSSQPARLTDAGEWFRGVAQDLLARVARVPGDARALVDASSATLRIAATHALSFTFLPSWLRSLESRTTVGPIRLVSDVLQRCEALMLEGKVQFALCHAHPHAPGQLDVAGCPSVKVGTDALVPVAAADGAGRPRHRLDAAGNVPLLRYSPESGIGRIVQAVHGQALAERSTTPVFTAHLASVLKTMVLDGRGIAWLPTTLIGDELASGRLVQAGPDGWRIDGLDIRLYRDPATLGATAHAFWNAAAESALASAAKPTRRVSARRSPR